MDYQLNELQQMLQESVEKYIERDYDFLTRQQLANTEVGYSETNWSQFAELGWLGLPFSEEDGGFGGAAGEIMVLMESFGKGLVLEPYLSSVVLGGQLLARRGSADQKAQHLPGLIAGELKLALAHSEPQARYRLTNVATTAQEVNGQFCLNGHKSVVLGGQVADQLLLSARTSGGQNDATGISLFLVPTTATGLAVRGYRTVDGLLAAEVTMDQLMLPPAALIGEPDSSFADVEWAVDQAIVAICAESLGCMEALHSATVEFLQTRKQFDVPIGKFQVLQHAAVDMFIALSQSRSMVYLAAMRADSPTAERRAAVSAAKNFIGRAGRMIGQTAVQLHGGLGVSDELDVSHYFKRLAAINIWFGDERHHLAEYSDQLIA